MSTRYAEAYDYANGMDDMHGNDRVDRANVFAGFVVGCDRMARASLGAEYIIDASLKTLWSEFQEAMQ